jgi:hypothetical protein
MQSNEEDVISKTIIYPYPGIKNIGETCYSAAAV